MNQKFSQLDQLFEESMARSLGRGTPMGTAYESGPLAADHYLLKRSWEYFKSRVRMIEEQWQKILESKDVQINSLRKELQAVREHASDLEDENQMLKSIDQSIKKARVEDYAGFNRKAEGLRLRWDSEREALDRKIAELEFQSARTKKDFETRLASARDREVRLKDDIMALKKDASLQGERDRDAQRRFSEEISRQAEAIQSLESKVEILRNEVDRRDQLIKQFKENISSQDKDVVAMTQFVAELQHTIREKDREIGHMKTRLDILRQEKDSMRAAWEREQAEWRELWDRGREAWERKR